MTNRDVPTGQGCPNKPKGVGGREMTYEQYCDMKIVEWLREHQPGMVDMAVEGLGPSLRQDKSLTAEIVKLRGENERLSRPMIERGRLTCHFIDQIDTLKGENAKLKGVLRDVQFFNDGWCIDCGGKAGDCDPVCRITKLLSPDESEVKDE